MKNIFMYATKELSQDAFLAWLIDSWNDCKCQDVSRNFLREVTDKRLNFDLLSNVSVVRQYKKIDIWVVLEFSDNTKSLLCIEDKTDSCEHTSQLKRYNQSIMDWGNANRGAKVYRLYYKTGYIDNTEKDRITNAGWRVFDLEKMLNFFNCYKSHSQYLISSYAQYIESLCNVPGKVSDWNLGLMHKWCDKDVRELLNREYEIEDAYIKIFSYNGRYVSMFICVQLQNSIRGVGFVALELKFHQKTNDKSSYLDGALYPVMDMDDNFSMVETWHRGRNAIEELKGRCFPDNYAWKFLSPARHNAQNIFGRIKKYALCVTPETVLQYIEDVVGEYMRAVQ